MPLDSNNEIYVDNAATTSMSKDVLDSMLPYFSRNYGNPSSLYSLAQVSRDAVEISRETISNILSCKPSEIVFNSGGTESDNLAIIGVSKALEPTGRHLITSKVEHHAVMHAMEEMESLGFKITYLNVDNDGFVDLDQLKECITSETTLVSIMYANNETGAIQPIKEISRIIKKRSIELSRDIYFHTDAVQAAGKLNLNVEELGVDLMTISGHKFYGPKGIGLLYVKKGIPMSPIILGGGQERQRRSGTENVPGIVGLAKALEIADSSKNYFNSHCNNLVNYIREKLVSFKFNNYIVTPKKNSLSNILNVCFENFEGEPILIGLDMAGICASSGSACSSASLEPSHVLIAQGIDPKLAVGSIRISLSLENTKDDIEYLVENLERVVSELSVYAKN
tara:strand:- start:1868 stop:3052 length:1185 start_codon:yes stop_codon:yes gene_type:complete